MSSPGFRCKNFRMMVLLATLLFARVAVAQSVLVPLRDMHHTAWIGESGPTLPGTRSIMRSSDGYLWIGARQGLMRFDGARFVVLDSAASPVLKVTGNDTFRMLFIDHEGAMFMSRPDGGLIKYLNERFSVVLNPARDVGSRAIIDGAGQIWLEGRGAHLRILRAGHAERVSLPRGVPDSGTSGIIRDTALGVWIGTNDKGLWHVVGLHAERVPIPDTTQLFVRPLLQSSDGALWALFRSALYRLQDGKWKLVSLMHGAERPFVANSAVEDSAHSVWLASNEHGVLRWHDGIVEQFTKTDGLSDASVIDVLPGDKGSIWIATTDALDQLRPAAFITINRKDGLPFDSPYRFAEDGNGALWGTGLGNGAVFELRGGVIEKTGGPLRVGRATLPMNDQYEVLRGAFGGGVFLGPVNGGLIRYRNGDVTRWTAKNGMPSARLWMALETRDSTLWVATVADDVFGRIRNGKFTAIKFPGDARQGVNSAVEDRNGHVWVSGRRSNVIYEFAGDTVARQFGPERGMPGPVYQIASGNGDTLWGVTRDGIIRVAAGRVTFVRMPTLLTLLAQPIGMVASETELWLAGSGGIVRVSLAALSRAMESKGPAPATHFFTLADGLASTRSQTFGLGSVFRARDGRVWISTGDGLSVVDPLHQYIDSTPPTLHVEELTASGHVIAQNTSTTIPPNPHNVSIRFTAINLFSPEGTRVQYQLEGVDESWVDVVGARVATYTQLRKGNYRFRLRAWNGEGVPSAGEATMSFRVLPAWYETLLAQGTGIVLVALAGAGAAFVFQRRKALRSAELMRSQFAATLAERTRIARELHDTLLQDFTGVVLLIDNFRDTLGNASPSHNHDLSRILNIADASLLEARQSVWDMRSPSLANKTLEQALQELVRDATTDNATAIRLAVTGLPYRLQSQLEMAALQIAREAVRNARNHARAQVVAIELLYEAHAMTLTVTDDGVGMEADRPVRASKDGHFGILGMRERAAHAGASLLITSAIEKGTTIQFVLPIARDGHMLVR